MARRFDQARNPAVPLRTTFTILPSESSRPRRLVAATSASDGPLVSPTGTARGFTCSRPPSHFRTHRGWSPYGATLSLSLPLPRQNFVAPAVPLRARRARQPRRHRPGGRPRPPREARSPSWRDRAGAPPGRCRNAQADTLPGGGLSTSVAKCVRCAVLALIVWADSWRRA
eukprot:scaffold1430_cov318-Prasinococcus_capsulatus_cf.AAC.2